MYITYILMANNRLHLDFSLTYQDERSAFLATYLTRPEFTTRPPTEEELETMANYILWAKDRTTGLNAKQEGAVQLSTRNNDWDSDPNCESLDALMESPTFNEASLQDISTPILKVKREVFSRDEALARCPEGMQDTFRALFRQIDGLDLRINYYDLLHNKRVNPPRDALLKKFSDAEKQAMQEQVTHWNQFQYLKQRHELIELRRQQYTLRDSYEPPQGRPQSVYTPEPEPFYFGYDTKFLPLGLVNESQASSLIFRSLDTLNPGQYSEYGLKQVGKVYWQKVDEAKQVNPGYFVNFENEEHWYEILVMWPELEQAAEYDVDGALGTKNFMDTVKYYIDFADLSDLQREILDLKLRRKKNEDIVWEINKKWKKSYTANYISTIFKQRIIPTIVEGVTYHKTIIDNLPYEEEFKQCTCCGRVLLRDSINFTKKTRSKDGFTSRCKKCEKNIRDNKNKE